MNIIPLFAPFLPDSKISPVVAPPRVKVLPLRLCIVELDALSERPLPLVDADRVAIGAPLFTPVIANLAEVVDCPPIAKSTVELRGYSKPFV